MLRNSASGVLASLRASTYGTKYDFGSSLAAALLDGLFEHPASPQKRLFYHSDLQLSSPSWDYLISLPAEEARGCGEIGIRTGLKIPSRATDVRVQPPPSPPFISSASPQAFHPGDNLKSQQSVVTINI